MNSDEIREWLGKETSSQLVRLKNILGLRFDELEPEPDLCRRAGHAISGANLAARNAEGALQMVHARMDTINSLNPNDDISGALHLTMQTLNMMTYAIESYIQMSQKYRQARDINTASLIAELSGALEKRENDGR